MRAAILTSVLPGRSLQIVDIPRPPVQPDHVLIRVVACGVCRTDLHIIERGLPQIQPQLVPGHQIVGEVVDGATSDLPPGTRVGVSWMGGVDGDCWYCRHGMENLCDQPTFTGYTVNGGFAEYALVRADFTFTLPSGLDDVHVGPLLCAGIIGFRSLPVAGVEHGGAWGSSGLGVLRVLRSRFFNPGNARYMSLQEANPIELPRSLLGRPGSATKTKSRRWHWIV